MARAQSWDPSERLPWLADTSRARPQPRQARRSWYPLVAAVSVAGAIAYGGWTAVERSRAPPPAPASVRSAETAPLSAPQAAVPQEARPQPPSASERAALRPAAEPTAAQRTVADPAPARRVKPATSSRRATARVAPKQRQRVQRRATAAPAYQPRAWSSGVRGRIIQVGAFATPAQAHREWNRVYYRHPLLRPLPPRVVRSNIRGRTYYRLQLGTFSHAHSELLCQRLRSAGEGCIVLGVRGNRR